MKFKIVDHEITIAYVTFYDKNDELVKMQSNFFVCQQQWVPIMKYKASLGLKKNKTLPCIKRTQFPLALSWACTAPKVQGLSLDGIISFDLRRQKSFS